MNTLVSNSIITAAAFAVAAIFSTQASAEQASEQVRLGATTSVQNISIPYAKVDLGSEQGRADLYRQIRHAAKKVCGPINLRDAGSLSLMSRNRQCYDDAVSVAVSQIGSGQMAALMN